MPNYYKRGTKDLAAPSPETLRIASTLIRSSGIPYE